MVFSLKKVFVALATAFSLASACAAERVLIVAFDSGSAGEFAALDAVKDLKTRGAWKEKVRGVIPFDDADQSSRALLKVTGPENFAVSPSLVDVVNDKAKLRVVRLKKMENAALDRVLAEEKDAGTLVLVTALKGDGMDRPLVMAGPGVRKGFEITETTAVYDIGATAAYALGIKPPQAWTGCPILSAFEGHGSRDDQQKSEQVSARVKRVIFLGFDGMSSTVFKNPTCAPFMRKLMAEGAWTMSCRSALPSSSSCNWASTFQGAGPELTGCDAGDNPFPSFTPAFVNRVNRRFPDVFHRLRRAKRAERTSMLAFNWAGSGGTVSPDSIRHTFLGEPYHRRDRTVPEMYEKYQPDFLGVIFNDPDAYGHRHGWASPEYEKCINDMDDRVRQVFESIRKLDRPDDVVVIISADHGGIRKTHGGTSPEEQLHPLIIWGKGVKRGFEITDMTAQYDIAATVMWLFGVEIPQCWRGRPVLSAFDCKAQAK